MAMQFRAGFEKGWGLGVYGRVPIMPDVSPLCIMPNAKEYLAVCGRVTATTPQLGVTSRERRGGGLGMA
jgi:hypothetical protein